MKIRFDDSLPAFVDVIVEYRGEDAFKKGVVLRDATGRLAFFSAEPLCDDQKNAVAKALTTVLGPYARDDRCVAGPDDFGAEEILNEESLLNVTVGNRRVRLADRRIVGADWLRAPVEQADGPPRFVFASIKGGVGRSTALAVTAAHLAFQGKKVLLLDLDMEAPGLGWMLLDDATRPEFGVIDALVENGVSGWDNLFLADLVSPSPLTNNRGRIDVVPAFGKRSQNNPGEVLAKLSRAYLEDVRQEGGADTILDQVRMLVERLTDRERYDAVLIDARAGLHETTAASILGLGAEVLLFGLNEPQNFYGYTALLSHLARFIPSDGAPPKWLTRLTMVQGKAEPEAEEEETSIGFPEECRNLFRDAGLSRPASAQPRPRLPDGSFSGVPWEGDDAEIDIGEIVGDLETDAGPSVVTVYENLKYRRFDPIRRPDLLQKGAYWDSYKELLTHIMQRMPNDGNDS
jgi:hypothetical protein